MWTTEDPAAYDAALRSPTRRWRSRVDVLYAGEVVTSLDVLVDGTVTLDDVAVRRSARLHLTDPTGTLAPASARDLLAPKGTEVVPYRGLVLADGSTAWVPLGTLGVTEPEVTRDGVSLRAMDRVDAVRLRRFSAPWQVVGGAPTHQAIVDIVTSRLAVDVRVAVTGSTAPELVYDALTDPWDAVRDLAQADDLAAFFDPLGSLSVQPEGQTETGVVYEPGAGSTLVLDDPVARSMSAEATYSGVVVTCEHPDRDPIRAEAWDLDPASPTYAGTPGSPSPFGRRPYGVATQVLTTQAQADALAARVLARVVRMRQQATLTTVGHVGHDVGDVVTVVHPGTRTAGRWTVLGGTVPVRPGRCSWRLQEAL